MIHEGSDYQVHIGTPSIEDYRRLREIAGLSPKSKEAAEKGLPNTLYATTIRYQAGETVAMGRVIGDNGCFYQIVDIAVDPSHQGKGLGKIIGAYVSLIADGPAKYLYAKFGFEPVTPESIGMAFRVQRT